MATDDPGLPPVVAASLRELVVEADAVAQQLGDEEGGADLEELARGLQKLESDARALLAMVPANPDLNAACAHVGQARDLIDDGMPADAAALEVLAAKVRMEASLKPA